MVTAFIILTVKAGTDVDIMDRLRQYASVKGVYEIYGAYDIFAAVEAERYEEIDEIKRDLVGDEYVASVQVLRAVKTWRRRI